MVLAGLFPPKQNEVWNQPDNDTRAEQLAQLWQPIAIETIESSRDLLLYPEANCSQATYEEQLMDNSIMINDFLNKNQQFINELKIYTGTNFSHWLEISYLYDTLFVEKHYFGSKFKQPDWIDQMGNDTMKKLKTFHDIEFSMFHNSTNYLRLRAGSILKSFITNMNKTLNEMDQNENYAYVYSTHDSILNYILSSFGLKFSPPTFGSGLIIELLVDRNQKPFVQVLYVNSTDNFSLKTIQLNQTNSKCTENCTRGCNQYCPYDRFVRLLDDYIPLDINQECIRKGN